MSPVCTVTDVLQELVHLEVERLASIGYANIKKKIDILNNIQERDILNKSSPFQGNSSGVYPFVTNTHLKALAFTFVQALLYFGARYPSNGFIYLALCQVRGMGKNRIRNLGSILLLRFFLTFFKFDIIFIFRNK